MKYIFLLIVIFTQPSFAAEANRQATVIEMLALAADRPNATGSQNLVRVYVNNASWGSTTCRADAVDLKKEDSHILSTLLFALAAQKVIIIAVDDTRRPYDDVCQLVWARIKF